MKVKNEEKIKEFVSKYRAENDYIPITEDTDLSATLYETAMAYSRHIDDVIQATARTILYRLYYLDCNRECDYSKMSGKEVVEEYNKALNKIQEEFRISDEDLFHYGSYYEEHE